MQSWVTSNTQLKTAQIQPFNSMTKICNSPYCQPYNSYEVSAENLVLDQLIVPEIDSCFYSHHLSA